MTQADDALAKKRFLALNAIRIMGALLAMAGFLLIRGVWGIVDQDTDRIIGVMIVLFGAFDFAVMPMLLAKRWRSPRDL